MLQDKQEVSKIAIQGTETLTSKCDEGKCRQKVLHEVFVKKGDDPQCRANGI